MMKLGLLVLAISCFVTQASAQYEILNLSIPGTSHCLINSGCYKKAAVKLFCIGVVLPTVSLLLFFAAAFLMNRRLNQANEEGLKLIELI